MTGTVARIYDILTGSHVYTTDVAEVARLTSNPARYRSEGAAFDSIGPNPVVRFVNQVTGGIFYTISPTEQAGVRQNPGFLEIPGGGFDAAIAPEAGLVPVYRFYNTVTGRHFFTPNAEEAASVRANLPGYRDEGVGFMRIRWVVLLLPLLPRPPQRQRLPQHPHRIPPPAVLNSRCWI